MKWKMALFVAGILLVGGAVFVLTESPLATFLCVVAVASYQVILFRCPHCRKLAFIHRNGVASPDVGDNCRHCGKE